MAHKTQMDFVRRTKQRFPERFRSCKVLEIGSLIIAGSVRDLFDGCDYTGCDLGSGPGVDIISPAHLLTHRDGIFDTVVSCEALEHDEHWGITLKAAVRFLKPGGLLCLTWAGEYRAEHGTLNHNPQDAPFTTDYYYAPPMRHVVDRIGAHMKHMLTEDHPQDAYLWGIKH